MWYVVIAVIVLLVIFAQFIPFDPNYFMFDQLGVILKKMFTPKGNRTWGDYFAYMWTLRGALLDTMKMSFAGTVIGSVLAVPLAVLSAKNIVKLPVIYIPMRFIMNIFRTIPAMVLAIIAVLFVGTGVLSGIIAITLFSFGIMAKMLYEVIETIDMNPYEVLESTGATRMESFRYAALPQILPVYVSYLIYIFEINVRTSAVLGFVGAGGIGAVISDNILYNYDRVGATIILIFFVILFVQFLSNYVRGKLQ